jgi:hypothetical protein
VIRQICLSCYKTVELPDDTAGKDAPCPNCGKAISVPAKYSAGVAEGGGLSSAPAAAPAPTVPTTASPGLKPGVPPMSDPSAPPGLRAETSSPPPPLAPTAEGGATHGFGVALDPRWLDWVPAACVVLAFFLSFFPWAEMKLGGYTVMTQNGWGALFGSVGDPVLPGGEEWKKLEKGLSGTAEEERYKAAVLRGDLLLLPYLLLLAVMVLLFAAERVIRDPAAFPATARLTFLPPLWKWRLVLLGGLAALALLLLWLQAFQGLGLQKAIDSYARFEVKERLAGTLTETEKREAWVKAGQEANKYPVQQSFWLNLLLTLHAVAVVAVAGRFWLAGREAKPLPRLDVKW